jgi:DNA-binding IclR family transcriptional regulator
MLCRVTGQVKPPFSLLNDARARRVFALKSAPVCAELLMPRVSANPANNVERVLLVMETLAGNSGLTISEIGRMVNLPKSSASYVLHTLERIGYVLRDADSRYRLSNKVTNLRQSTVAVSELRTMALPILTRIVERTKLIACLAVLDGGEALYVHKVDAPSIRIDDYVRPRMDTHATAAGKALLAYLPEREVEVVVGHSGLRRWTCNTITARDRFAAELQQTRNRGYALDSEEYARGLRCVAAPIFGALGNPEACVGVAGRPEQLSDNLVAQVGVLVRESARMLSEQLGYRIAVVNSHI